ncbi:MAG: PP2C family protein-serine/threonine phosphatase [Anaerovorax sp.]
MQLKENLHLMGEVIEKMDYMVRVMDADRKVIYMNEKMRKAFGNTKGAFCFDLLGGQSRCENCITAGSRETGKPQEKDVSIGDQYFKLMSSPVSIDTQEKFSIELLHEITEQKKIEVELLKHYEKLKEDIAFAKQIQHRALPIDGEYWNCLRTTTLYIQSEDLGGDIFDIIKLGENRVLTYIADVSGHGIKSSLLTIFLRQVIRGSAKKENLDMKELLDDLLKNYTDLHTNMENYLTILCAIYDKSAGTVSFANAGHNCLPILVTKDGSIREVSVKGMPVCNLIETSEHEVVTVEANPGDRIILYTDGISESYSKVVKRQFGAEGIIEVIEEYKLLDNKQLASKIIQSAAAFAGIIPIDDMALVIAEVM